MAILKTVGLMTLSLGASMALFYILNNNEKTVKKRQLEELFNYIIQFIIYIWISKIIVFLPKFIHDPLSVLAYPSDSRAFYLAHFFIAFHLLYKARKKAVNVQLLLEVFAFVWLGALFMYEFFGIITQNQTFDPYFIEVMGLLLLFILLYEKIPLPLRDYGTLFIWSLFSLVISLVNGYVVLFGYLILPAYFTLLCCLFALGTWYHGRHIKQAD
jgi:hypothetical protein